MKFFVGMVKYLFNLKGVKFFLSEKISQDPLEKFFENQRQRGVNENPTAAAKKRVREDDSLQESTPLRKRKAVRKKLNLISY